MAAKKASKATEEMAQRVIESLAYLPGSLREWGAQYDPRVRGDYAGKPEYLLDAVPRILELYRKMQSQLPAHIRRLQTKGLSTERLNVLLPWAHTQWDADAPTRSDVTWVFDAIVDDLIDAGEIRRGYDTAGREVLMDPDAPARATKKEGAMKAKKATKKKTTKKATATAELMLTFANSDKKAFEVCVTMDGKKFVCGVILADTKADAVRKAKPVIKRDLGIVIA